MTKGMTKIVLVVLLIIAAMFVLSLIAAIPFMYIWNYAVVAALSIATPINYTEAFWLVIFISMFFGASKAGTNK